MTSLTTRLDGHERNMMINGNIDLAQRIGIGAGGTGNFSNAGRYGADRFLAQVISSSLTINHAVVADAPTQAQSGFNSVNSLKVTNTGGTTVGTNDLVDIQHRIEGYEYQQIHGRRIRKQFWVKSSVAGTYSLSFFNQAQTRSYTTTYSIPAANTWTFIPIDVMLDQAGTWNFDNTAGLYIFWGIASGSGQQTSNLNVWQNGSSYVANTQTPTWGTTAGATFQIAQCMLIPTDFTPATPSQITVPFRRAGWNISQEIMMAQRYYEKSMGILSIPGTNFDNGYDSPATTVGGNSVPCIIRFKVSKNRIPDTPTLYNTITSTSGSWSGFTTGGVLTSTLTMNLNQLTQEAFLFYASGTGFARIFGDWVANAEI